MALCLVTGHQGYIGSALYGRLISLDHDVVGIDYKRDPSWDILNGLERIEKYDFDYIFHLACIPRVAYSVEQPIHTMMNNVLSTSIVLEGDLFRFLVGRRKWRRPGKSLCFTKVDF